MSVLAHLIYSPGGGGAEAMLRGLVRAMAGSGWQTHVIVMDGASWPVEMHELRSSGAQVHDLGCRSYLQRQTLVKLVQLLRSLRPQVLQTWMHHADLVGGFCARLAGLSRVVWGIHCREIHAGAGDSPAKLRLFRTLLGLSSHAVPSRIVSCSAVAMEDHVRLLGYPQAKMQWVPNGIDTSRFLPDSEARATVRAELRVPPETSLVGFLGRFHEMKDLPTWLRAAGLLQSRKPETHFWLCGGREQDLGDCARAALSVMPRRDQVHFSDFRPEPQRVYPALDVFSLSSRTEACPMTLMEALACGVPCAATDVGDCGRLLEGLGLVVPAHGAEALAQAWAALLESPPSADALRQAAVARFDIATAARGYLQVYEEVLRS